MISKDKIAEQSESFFHKALGISEMDDQILKRVLFEYIKDRWKEQIHCENRCSPEIIGRSITT